MRKSFFHLMTIAIVLASCGKVQNLGTFRNGEIYFGSSGITVETRSVVEGSDAILQANGFKAAVVLDSDNSVMFNKSVAYSAGAYTVPGETYYYPAEGTISAYAVYPSSETITLSSGIPTVSYSQNASVDMICAKATEVAKQSSAIALEFVHTLAQVSVKCQGQDANASYILKSVKFSTPSSAVYAISSGTWTNPGERTANTYYTNAGASVPVDAMQGFGETMTFIPAEDVDLNVVWLCKNKTDGTVVGEYDQTIQVNLTKGKKTTFNLTLPNSDAEEIKFSVSVASWASEDKSFVIE